jgi:pimeloyl-ACP methyl ester carboxylesterase
MNPGMVRSGFHSWRRPAAKLRAVLWFMALAAPAGCVVDRRPSGRQAELFDRAGRTYYIDGAGNWGYGVTEVQDGLQRAGYHGNVINFRWSYTFNPALDQTIGRVAARARAKDLAKEITAYLARYPDNHVNIIALSAGTGVAVWACEALQPPAKVHNLILLGSSLSSRYDMRKALENIEGGVWVYYSPYDQVLNGPVRALGTIDGELGVDSAGLVGLHPPGLKSDKIHNIGWSARWERYGWGGAHTDATSEPFVRHELSKHILPPKAADMPATRPAQTMATVVQAQ